jgi:ADP-dependent NAD(P)H-hydrate dehydratase
MTPAALDAAWLRAHPLPTPDSDSDKNSRGRVLVVGGAEFVPGALRLTGEAALRAGAGKLQMATVRSAAMSLGVLVPEAAMIALPAQDDGEIAAGAARLLTSQLERCDALVLGPGMNISAHTDEFVAAILAAAGPEVSIILDAAALTSGRELRSLIAAHDGHVILTPHHGEMAILTGLSAEAIAQDPAAIALRVASDFRAIVILKGDRSVIAGPDGACLLHEGGCVGLATGGSGDVLAGIVGGLAARGSEPMRAAAWGSWVHGKAGRTLAQTVGSIGFLARELLPLIPRLLDDPDCD